MTTQHMSLDEIAKVDEMQKGGSGADEILTRLQKMLTFSSASVWQPTRYSGLLKIA